MNIKRMVKERDEAFTDFVLTGRAEKVRAYCRKYSVWMPARRAVFEAGIYKAVQLCTDIPQDVKDFAAVKLSLLRFSPRGRMEP